MFISLELHKSAILMSMAWNAFQWLWFSSLRAWSLAIISICRAATVPLSCMWCSYSEQIPLLQRNSVGSAACLHFWEDWHLIYGTADRDNYSALHQFYTQQISMYNSLSTQGNYCDNNISCNTAFHNRFKVHTGQGYLWISILFSEISQIYNIKDSQIIFTVFCSAHMNIFLPFTWHSLQQIKYITLKPYMPCSTVKRISFPKHSSLEHSQDRVKLNPILIP